jgi:hypothetical protein
MLAHPHKSLVTTEEKDCVTRGQQKKGTTPKDQVQWGKKAPMLQPPDPTDDGDCAQ